MVIQHLSWSGVWLSIQSDSRSKCMKIENHLKSMLSSSSTIFLLCSPSYPERVYKSNSSHRHPFFSGLPIVLLKDLSCLSLSCFYDRSSTFGKKTRQKGFQNNSGPMLTLLQLAFIAFIAIVCAQSYLVEEEAQVEEVATAVSC